MKDGGTLEKRFGPVREGKGKAEWGKGGKRI